MVTGTYPLFGIRHQALSDVLLLEEMTDDDPETWAPLNLTGYTARMQVRTLRNDTATLLATLDTATTGLTLGGVAGTVAFTLPGTLTGLIDAGDWPYDLMLVTPSGDPTYLVEGLFHLAESVTTP